jgi:hypothetical protein
MNDAIQALFDRPWADAIGEQLAIVESDVYREILAKLRAVPTPGCGECDKIFGSYTRYLRCCRSQGLESRAAWFSRERLIPAVLDLERRSPTPFHKGALFYDTGLAHLLSGNEDGYEYFLAMSDEEDFRKTGGLHQRGTSNLHCDGLAKQTVTKRLEFACELLNGRTAHHAADFAFTTRMATITPERFDAWRQTLGALHQFELLRIIHDVEVWLGVGFPIFPPCADNPVVLLRLAKALSHLAQWVESCLTHWQLPERGGGLSGKLINDPDFGEMLSKAAGGCEKFARKCPDSSKVDSELNRLMSDLGAAPAGKERQWRLLRILYIVRNSTAHTIEPNLALYKDRAFLVNLLQVVFVSVFALCQLKAKPVP